MAEMQMECLRLERVDEAMEIIEQARAFLRESGSTQWQKGYPFRETLVADANAQTGWVLVQGDAIIGYVCIDFGGEPVYDVIDGAWLTSGPYGTIHRMAIGTAARGKGCSRALFEQAEQLALEEGIQSLRIDTAEANSIMQHLIEQMGYRYCGIVQHSEGPRLAYEKLLH